MGTHSDQKYIDALLHNDHKGIQEIYSLFAPKVINYIKKNSGGEMAARDVIQESLIVIYDQAKTKGLTLSCPFDAYFFLICKRKWLNQLKKNDKKRVTIEDEIAFIDKEAQTQADATGLFEERTQLFNTMLSRLGNACKQLLKLSFSIKSMEEVAKKLEVSYAYARKKKSLCIGKLTKMIQEAPQYNDLKGV